MGKTKKKNFKSNSKEKKEIDLPFATFANLNILSIFSMLRNLCREFKSEPFTITIRF